MIRTINALSPAGQLIGYALLIWGFIVTALFVTRYVSSLPWYASEEGRHLTAMTANIWAFFAVYLVQMIWPDIPGRPYILLGLLVFFVANCTWRWLMLERFLTKRRRTRRDADASKR